MAKKVLLVDDEEDILDLLKYNLEREGIEVSTAKDGPEAIRMAAKEQPDLVVLDIMMPGMDGVEVCSQLRRMPSMERTLIAFLTARSEDYSHIAGYEAGADDYITKPFDSEILLFKIKALLNRSETIVKAVNEQVEFVIGGFKFNSRLRTIQGFGKEEKLSPKEAALLALLCVYLNDILPREVALRKIWNDDNYFTARSMDVFITKIRKYLKDDPNIELLNVHGNGYRLVVKD